MQELSQKTQKLIQKYQSWQQSMQIKEGLPTIHVDEVSSTVAAFYEKIRGVVDWREEHLMRRAAIERNLKRRLILSKDAEEITYPFVTELIRAGHFPNDQIEESKTDSVKNILDKYIYIIENSPAVTAEKVKAQLYDWILGVAACEIEETLCPPIKEKALIEYMAESMKEKIEIKGVQLTEEEKTQQIYVAVQKALFKMDNAFITYTLLKKMYHDWKALSKNNPLLQEITINIYSIWNKIEKIFKHPLTERLYRVCERYDTPYLIVGDVISENPEKAAEEIKNPEALESKIKWAYNKRQSTLGRRIQRAAIYATLSIFVTKILLATLIEIPFDKYVTGEFSPFVLGLNIAIPPFLMFLLVLTIQPPKKENLQRVIMEAMKIAYETERKDYYTIKAPRRMGGLMNSMINFIYFLTYCLTFGLIVWGLRELNFGVLSIVIFLIFISLISFAGVKIRERSRELEMIREKESILIVFLDIFSIPLMRIGKWLSGQWARFNVLVILFNFLLDLPFQSFIEFLEQWRNFLREKKEEIH